MLTSIALELAQVRLTIVHASQEAHRGSFGLVTASEQEKLYQGLVSGVEVLSDIQTILIHPQSMVGLLIQYSLPYSVGQISTRKLFLDTRNDEGARIDGLLYRAGEVRVFRQEPDNPEHYWGLLRAIIGEEK